MNVQVFTTDGNEENVDNMTRIERILVVDDERGPRESMRMILKDKYQVITVDQAKKALEEINKHNIDLAILDIKMPEMDGIELLAAIKKIDPGVEVLMVTGYANVDTAVNAMRLPSGAKRGPVREANALARTN